MRSQRSPYALFKISFLVLLFTHQGVSAAGNNNEDDFIDASLKSNRRVFQLPSREPSISHQTNSDGTWKELLVGGLGFASVLVIATRCSNVPLSEEGSTSVQDQEPRTPEAQSSATKRPLFEGNSAILYQYQFLQMDAKKLTGTALKRKQEEMSAMVEAHPFLKSHEKPSSHLGVPICNTVQPVSKDKLTSDSGFKLLRKKGSSAPEPR